MKVRVTMKDPDGVWQSLEDAGLDMNQQGEDARVDTVLEWFEYDEYVSIEIDLETGKAEVIKP